MIRAHDTTPFTRGDVSLPALTPAHSPCPLAHPEGVSPRRREKVGWLAPCNLFPPALREIGRERCSAHDRAKPKRAHCAPLWYCAGARAARTPLLAATGRHSATGVVWHYALRLWCHTTPCATCPPSALIGSERFGFARGRGPLPRSTGEPKPLAVVFHSLATLALRLRAG